MLGEDPMNVASLLREHRASPAKQIPQPLKVFGPHVDAGEGAVQLRALVRGNFVIPVAHGLDDLGGPSALAKLHTDLLRSTGKLCREGLVHEVTHGRLRAFHEQSLKLNHNLNDAIGFGTSLRRENAGVLQRRQQGHGSPDWSGRRASLRLHWCRQRHSNDHHERQPHAGPMHGAIIQNASRGHQRALGAGTQQSK